LLDWNAEDLQVDVLGVRDSGLGIRDALHETVTHPTADDECAAAGVTHAGSERCDECWSCSTVHRLIICVPGSKFPVSGSCSSFRFDIQRCRFDVRTANFERRTTNGTPNTNQEPETRNREL